MISRSLALADSRRWFQSAAPSEHLDRDSLSCSARGSSSPLLLHPSLHELPRRLRVRRFIGWWLAALILSALGPLACTAQNSAQRPNVLIVTVDDMSADSVGAFGCRLPDTTPHLDQLARQSLSFDFAHVQVGNCMPSRNVMWSGRYPHHNRVEGFYQVKDADYPVLCDLFREAGYFTAIRGKVNHSTPYTPYAWDLVLDTDEQGSRYHVKDPASYGASTRRGIAAARAAGKPFCLLINVSDPHKPFYAEGRTGATVPDPHEPSRVFTADEVPVPGFLFDDPVVRKELAHYYSSVRRADDCVGQILTALEESGAAPETLVLFLSDHGMPLPFAKTQLYHHSTRTPLMVRWPGKVAEGTRDQTHLVSAVDFLPTLLDAAGISHPEGLDGRSFYPLLFGEAQGQREYVIKEYNENAGASRDPMRAVQTRQHLYIFNPWSNGQRVMATATTGTPTYRRLAELARTQPELAARLQLYRHRVVEELYDVQQDPDCLRNLIDDPESRSVLAELRQTLDDWMQATGDPLRDVYRQREDAAAREAFVAAQEQEAEARRAGRGRGANRKRNQNTRGNRRESATNGGTGK